MRSVPSPVIHTPIHKTIRTNQRMLNAERLRATALLRERTSGFDKSENAIQLLPADVLAPTTMKNAAKCDT